MSKDIDFYLYTKMPHTSEEYTKRVSKTDANYTKCGDLPSNYKKIEGQKYCPVKTGYFDKGFAGQTCKPPSDIDKHYMQNQKIYKSSSSKSKDKIIDKHKLDFSGAKTKHSKGSIDKSKTWGQEREHGIELCDTHGDASSKMKTMNCDPLYKRDMNATAEDYDCGDGYASIYDIQLPSKKFKTGPYNINEPRHFYDINKIYPTYTNDYRYYSVKNIGGPYLGAKFHHDGGDNDKYHPNNARSGTGPFDKFGMYRWGPSKNGSHHLRHPETKPNSSNKWSSKFNNMHSIQKSKSRDDDGKQYETHLNNIIKQTIGQTNWHYNREKEGGEEFKINDNSLYLKHQQPSCPILHGVSPSKVRYIDLPNYKNKHSLVDIHNKNSDPDEAFPSERILKCSYNEAELKKNSSNVYKWLDYKNRHQNFPVYRSLYDYVKLSNINFGLNYNNMSIEDYKNKKIHKNNKSLNYYLRGNYGELFKKYINHNLTGINKIYSESCKNPYVTYLDKKGNDKMGSLDTCKFTSEQSKSHLCNYEGDNYETRFIQSLEGTNTNMKTSLSNVICPPLQNPKYNNGIQGYKPQFINNKYVDPKHIVNLTSSYPIKSSYKKDWFGFQKGIDIPLRECKNEKDGDPTKLQSYKCYDLKKGKETDMNNCKTGKALQTCKQNVEKCHKNKKQSECNSLSEVSDKNPCLMDNRYMLFNECHNKQKESYELSYSEIGYLSPCDQLIYKAVINALKPQCKYDTDKNGNYYQYPNCFRKKEDIKKDLDKIFSFLDKKEKPSYDYSFYYDENWYYPSKPGNYIDIYNHKPKRVRGSEKGQAPNVDNLSKLTSSKLIKDNEATNICGKSFNTSRTSCKRQEREYYIVGTRLVCKEYNMRTNISNADKYCNAYQYNHLITRGNPYNSKRDGMMINPGWWEGQYNNHPIYHPINKNEIKDDNITSGNQELNNYYLDLSSIYKKTQDYWTKALGKEGWKGYCKDEEPDRELWTKVRDMLNKQSINDDDKKIINNNKKTCDESLSGKGEDYRGCQNETRSGKKCISWARAGKINLRGNSKEAEDGLGGHNFCRNPKGEKETIWCYTGPGKTELCDPIGKPFPYTLVKKETECKSPPWPFVGRGKTLKDAYELAVKYPAMNTPGGGKRKTTYFSVGHNRNGGARCNSSGCRVYNFGSDCDKSSNRNVHRHYDLYRITNRDEKGNDIKQKKKDPRGNEETIKKIDETIFSKDSKPGSSKQFKVCSKFHLKGEKDVIDPYQCNSWMSDIYKIDETGISSDKDLKSMKHQIDKTLQPKEDGLCKQYPELPECACYNSTYNKYMLDELKIMASNNVPVSSGFKGCSILHPCGTRNQDTINSRPTFFYPENTKKPTANISMYSTDYWDNQKTFSTLKSLQAKYNKIEDKENKIFLKNGDYSLYMYKVDKQVHYNIYYQKKKLNQRSTEHQPSRNKKISAKLSELFLKTQECKVRSGAIECNEIKGKKLIMFFSPAPDGTTDAQGKKSGDRYLQLSKYNEIIKQALADKWTQSFEFSESNKGWSEIDRNNMRKLLIQINNLKKSGDKNFTCPKSCSITFKAGNVYGNAQYNISQSCGQDVSKQSKNVKTPSCGSITTKDALSYCSQDNAKSLGFSNSSSHFFGKTGHNDNQICSQPLTYPGGKALAPCHKTVKKQQEKFMPLCCEQSCQNYSKNSCSKNQGACFMYKNMTSITSKTTCEKHKGTWITNAFTGELNKNLESIYPRKNQFCCETSEKDMIPDFSTITTEQFIHNLLEYIPYDITLTKESGSTDKSLKIIKDAIMKDLFTETQAKQKANEVLFTKYPERTKTFTLSTIQQKLQNKQNNLHKVYQSITNEKIDLLLQLVIIRIGYNPQGVHYFLDKEKAIFKVQLDTLKDNEKIKQQAINNNIKSPILSKDSSQWSSKDKENIINGILQKSNENSLDCEDNQVKKDGECVQKKSNLDIGIPDFSSFYQPILDFFRGFSFKNIFSLFEGFQTNTKPKKNMIEICIPICFLMICLCICICILKYSS